MLATQLQDRQRLTGYRQLDAYARPLSVARVYTATITFYHWFAFQPKLA
jgi:hypothetical protein